MSAVPQSLTHTIIEKPKTHAWNHEQRAARSLAALKVPFPKTRCKVGCEVGVRNRVRSGAGKDLFFHSGKAGVEK